MTADYATDYRNTHDREDIANSLRRRQLQEQNTLARLTNRTDYVGQPGVIGTREQSIGRTPMGDIQRIPAGQQIVQNPNLLKRAIMPQAPMGQVSRPVPMSGKPVQKIQKYPLQNTTSILNAGGLPTGMPVRKWPTSFKKAYHKPTPDENIMRGLNNLNSMSRGLLGKGRW